MSITLNLKPEIEQEFADFYGATDEDPAKVVERRLLEFVQNQITEKRNRDAILAASSESAPAITTDGAEFADQNEPEDTEE